MKDVNNKISVAMATYNGEKYIYEQIRTILANLDDDDELVISDDGSKDKTIQIINDFNDKRIKLISGPQKGLVKNFENAIKNTNGDYIFLTDQDDLWTEDKVKKVMKCFEDNNYILIQHDAVIIDGKENVMYESFFKKRKVKTGIIKNMIKNSYHGCCMAFKKELIDEILPIPETVYLHDQWIGMIAELNGKTYFLNEKLMKYRRYEGNASSFTHLPIKTMIKNRINYLRALIIYYKRRKE